MIKKLKTVIWAWLIVWISSLFMGLFMGTSYADTIGGSFVSIPIHKTSTGSTDITQDLNLKAGWLVDQTNWVYYVIGTIPTSWSWETVAGIDVKSASNCDDADINSTCIEAGQSAVFVLKWNDNAVSIQKIIQLYWNWTKAWTAWWGLHKNAKWNVFLIENIWSDIRLWTLVGSDLSNPTLTADSPVTIDANIYDKEWISIVNDYLFFHWDVSIATASNGRNRFPRFVVISLNGTTPTMVYQWGKDEADDIQIMLKLSQNVNSIYNITPSMVQWIFLSQWSNNPLVPYSTLNWFKQGYNYILHLSSWRNVNEMYIKWMFVKDNKLYAIVRLGTINWISFYKAQLDSNGNVELDNSTKLNSSISSSKVYTLLWKYFIMQFDFSPVNQ